MKKGTLIVAAVGILLTIVLISSCAQNATESIEPEQSSEKLSTESENEISKPIPTPSKDLGMITGRLISITEGKPIVNYLVYLGDKLPLTPGDEYLITLQAQGSPHVVTDSNGDFVFVDLEPGEYPLIVWSPSRSLVIPNEDGTKELNALVEAGKITELGELSITWP